MYFVHDISNIFNCFNVGHASSFILVLISPSHRNGRNFRKLWRRWQVCLCSSIYRVHSWSSICIWGRQAYATSGNYIAVNRYLYFIDLVVNTTLFLASFSCLHQFLICHNFLFLRVWNHLILLRPLLVIFRMVMHAKRRNQRITSITQKSPSTTCHTTEIHHSLHKERRNIYMILVIKTLIMKDRYQKSKRPAGGEFYY